LSGQNQNSRINQEGKKSMFLLGMLVGVIAAPVFWTGTVIGALWLYKKVSDYKKSAN
jgi:hypothetical protein